VGALKINDATFRAGFTDFDNEIKRSPVVGSNELETGQERNSVPHRIPSGRLNEKAGFPLPLGSSANVSLPSLSALVLFLDFRYTPLGRAILRQEGAIGY